MSLFIVFYKSFVVYHFVFCVPQRLSLWLVFCDSQISTKMITVALSTVQWLSTDVIIVACAILPIMSPEASPDPRTGHPLRSLKCFRHAVSNEALRSFSNSTFILREVQRDTGRVTDYVNSASGQTREGEISIIWRRPSGDTALGQSRSAAHLVF